MRILLVGAGGVGTAFARIAARRPFAELVIADYDLARAQHAAGRAGRVPGRPAGRARRARDRVAAGRASLRRADERHRPAVRDAALPRRAPGRHQLPGHGDVAVSAGRRRALPPDRRQARRRPVRAGRASGKQAGKLALVGMGVEPGLSDVFARYAADDLFSEIDELGVRDGANLTVAGYDFAPTFSIWTTIEECLNPPVIWEAGQGLVHHRAVQRARGVHLPGRHRPGGVRERGARGGAADAALDPGPAGHLQVRPRRRVHRRPGDPAQARTRRHRPGAGRRGQRVAARRGRRLPAGPGHPGRPR